ncbi:MAG: phospholipase D-like domain-containing protein, partial [Pseudomonadota bacterium]|nr:phospholipase D-like domain-containing protein [Pseudomonadota bacterium]
MALLFIVVLVTSTGIYGSLKTLDDGMAYQGPLQPAHSVTLLQDITWQDNNGRRVIEHEIFDAAFNMIQQARFLVVLDMFLFNDFMGVAGDGHRPLSRELTDTLIERIEAVPTLDAVFITDPINSVYGGYPSPYLDELRAAGITVLETPLGILRDSNPLWSSPYRLVINPLPLGDFGALPNPFGEGTVGLRSYLTMLNFKANHRKVLIADAEGEELVGLVTSANPHDASSLHSNMAVRFSGPAVLDLLESENTVLRLAGYDPLVPPAHLSDFSEQSPSAQVAVLTESAIRDAAIAAIDQAVAGDQVYLMMFYLSHRGIVDALKEARIRGADVRLILDPNRDAFGRTKNGIPNRQVASELMESRIPVRWANTNGEQFHVKTLIVVHNNGEARLLTGSGNFTRRNLDNYNLETDVLVVADKQHPAIAKGLATFHRLWSNQGDVAYTQAFEAFADDSSIKYAI